MLSLTTISFSFPSNKLCKILELIPPILKNCNVMHVIQNGMKVSLAEKVFKITSRKWILLLSDLPCKTLVGFGWKDERKWNIFFSTLFICRLHESYFQGWHLIESNTFMIYCSTPSCNPVFTSKLILLLLKKEILLHLYNCYTLQGRVLEYVILKVQRIWRQRIYDYIHIDVPKLSGLFRG